MPKQLSHKVIVLSLDAMTFEDFSKARDLTGFSWFWERGAGAPYPKRLSVADLSLPCRHGLRLLARGKRRV